MPFEGTGVIGFAVAGTVIKRFGPRVGATVFAPVTFRTTSRPKAMLEPPTI